MDAVLRSVAALKTLPQLCPEAQWAPSPAQLQSATLRPYQRVGVTWLLHNYEQVRHRRGPSFLVSLRHSLTSLFSRRRFRCWQNINGILADEMGLGKTLQTIAFFLLLQERQPENRPFLVVCPLSLVDNWASECARFAPSLGTLVYTGAAERRAAMREEIAGFVNALPRAAQTDPPFRFRVFITTYEICNSDFAFLQQFRWRYLVVDEAARLKNAKSLLYETLVQLRVPQSCLLTGTPVQNNLRELHALLSFGMPKFFGDAEAFVAHFAAVGATRSGAATAAVAGARTAELHQLLRPFVLRRVKADVLGEMPPKRELTFYAEISPLQRYLYRALLLKDVAALVAQQKKGLNNMLMQLRKCVNHPYLFDGVEPEPFEAGEHLVHASGKLLVLDRLLALLKRRGSRVLIFSQMTQMLDILQGTERKLR